MAIEKTKIERLYEMLFDQPMRVDQIADALNSDVTPVRSLLADLREDGVVIWRQKFGSGSFYGILSKKKTLADFRRRRK